ncbi:MAG: adenylyltransferase/cytidyltransferase family protein [Verrucomicrobia bacterium]|nr:adenylyltransferase/cytidyltransferase family protein [Verrucomicrobiota bacterium]
MPQHIVVAGAFDDLRSGHLRFLEEAAKLGDLTVLLWPDDAVQQLTGQAPKFPQAERLYFLNAVRYVSQVSLVSGPVQADALPEVPGYRPDVWVVGDCRANPAKEAHAAARGVAYHVLSGERQPGFPEPPPLPTPPGRKKVVVTGCYDWFHSGHVRFFEEVSAYGDLYVIIGHDANIRLLKGEGHPLLPQDERRYLVGSIKFVKQALISSGDGWLDADPEIQRLKPDFYAVNEDGDRGGKREYCAKQGIEYLVLKRAPAPGLPKRSSTDLRGF